VCSQIFLVKLKTANTGMLKTLKARINEKESKQ